MARYKWPWDVWPIEPFMGVDVLADFDIVRFFGIVQSKVFKTQIETG